MAKPKAPHLGVPPTAHTDATPPDIAEMLAFIGDARWWERADCFSNAQARAFVPDLAATVAELRALYPADVCKDLVRCGDGALVVPLFYGGGWNDAMDELLQLGDDLTHCAGWRDDHKLVYDLRHGDSYEAARFDIGIWAGLRRVGLVPEHEPAENASVRRADFRFTDGSHRVALELKSLADPQRSRNRELLHARLSLAGVLVLSDDVGSIILEPDEALDTLLDGTVAAFEQALNQMIWPGIAAHLRPGVDVGRYAIQGVGTLVIGARDPSWSDREAGTVGVAGEDIWSLDYAARRVLSRVVAARRQLVATEADLRAAVVWGGYDHVPCRIVAAEVERLIGRGYRLGDVDYVAIVNSHRRGLQPGWTTEATVLAARTGVPDPDTMTWPAALVSWSRLHRG